MARIARIIVRVFGWLTVIVLGIFLLVFILIQLPPVQNGIRKETVSFLQDKLKTKVVIGKLSISFPSKIVLENVLFEDQRKVTLLSGKRLAVNISLMKLLDNQLQIRHIELDSVRTNIYRRNEDSSFNFQYIVDAFATPTQPVDTTAAPMSVDLDRIDFYNVGGNFMDAHTGNDLDFVVKRFSTRVTRFLPDSMQYAIPTLFVDGLSGKMRQYKPLVAVVESQAQVEAKSDQPLTAKLDLGTVDLNNISFSYNNDISSVATSFNVGEMFAEVQSINLQSLEVNLTELALKNSRSVIKLGRSTEAKKVAVQAGKEVEAQVNNPWKVKVSEVDFENNDFKLDNDNEPIQRVGFDYAHFDLKDITLKASALEFTPVAFKGNVDQMAFADEKSKFLLKQLQANFIYDDKQISIEDLLLETDKTVLRDRAVLRFPSLASISKNPGEMQIDAKLDRTNISVKDLITWVPSFVEVPAFSQNQHAVFYVNTEVSGYLKNLFLPYLQFRGFSGTNIDAKGRIVGLPDAQNAVYDLTINKLVTNKKDINALLPKGTLPPNINLPNSINMSGSVNGSMAQLSSRFNINTDKGSIDGVATFSGTRKSYNLRANATNLDLGYIISNPSLGKVSANIVARGVGFDPATANAMVDFNVRSARVNGYTYRNVDADIELRKGIAYISADSRDPNASLKIRGTANLKGKFPALDFDISANRLDLHALGLVTEPMVLEGEIDADIINADPAALAGTINAGNLFITYKGERYHADSLSLVATSTAGRNSLKLRSKFANADLQGRYDLTEIAPAVMQTIDRYYNIPGFKPAPFKPQEWTLKLSVFPEPFLFQFMPQLKGSDSLIADASFNSVTNQLDVAAKASRLVFNNQTLDSLNLTAATAGDRLNYSLTAQSFNSPSLKLAHTTVAGYVANNQVLADATSRDPLGNTQYAFSALAQQEGDGARIKVNPGNLILNYDKWNVSGDNYVVVGPKGILINNLNISLGNQALLIQSSPPQLNAPININFSNFNIRTIARLANQDTLLADGVVNGLAIVRDVLGKPTFTSDLTIDNLTYKQDTVGNVKMNVQYESSNVIDANVQVSGRNDLSLTGKYYVSSEEMDLNVNLRRFDLATLKGLAAPHVRDAGGEMLGNISIKGKFTDPRVLGDLNFKGGFIAPSVLGERFTFPDDGFTITSDGLRLENFVVKDSLGNQATVNGAIYTKNFLDYRFDLTAKTKNFRVINSKPGYHKPFYGLLTVDSDIEITGTMESPRIDGFVFVQRTTDFYIVTPSPNPELQSRQGVVEFVDIDSLRGDTLQLAMVEDTVSRYANLKGLEFYLNLETDTAAQFTVVLDERNGDAIKMKGNGDIAMVIDKSGKVSLTGTYELTAGSYEISLNVVGERRFEIQRGSQITFTGDPTTGMINVTAVYIASAPALDLVQPQLVGRSPAEVNRFKQRLPFNVILNITGEIMQPIIKFDINLPENRGGEWSEVETKLEQVRRDEAELNKQVFALLLLNRFVGENPFEAADVSGDSYAETFMRETATRVLTEQLNQLTEGMLPGVDLNFGVVSYEDYSTGQHQNRTDLTVGVSKQLLNDRLRVNVGSNFQLEGGANTNQQRNNIIGDVSLDYQLSSDGRYIIRAYRRNEYEAVVEGQVIETGLSFIYTIDFDKFRDMFRRKPKEATLRKEENNKTTAQK